MASEGRQGSCGPAHHEKLADLYLEKASRELEQRFAMLRMTGVSVGVTAGILLTLYDLLPLVFSRWVMLSLLIAFALFAHLYHWARPYEQRSLRGAASAATGLDLLFVCLLILNTGGMGSLVWTAVPLVAMAYVLRFGLRWKEAALGAVLIISAAILSQLFAPIPRGQAVLASTAILVVIAMTLNLASASTRRFQKAARVALAREDRAMDLLVNALEHEVNNPLAILHGNVEILRQRGVLEEGDDHLVRIQAALDRISASVQRLKELKRDPRLREVGTGELLPRFMSEE